MKKIAENPVKEKMHLKCGLRPRYYLKFKQNRKIKSC